MTKKFLSQAIRTAAIVFAASVAMCWMAESANAQGCGYGGRVNTFHGGGYGYGLGTRGVSVNINRGYYGGFGGVNVGVYRSPYYRRPSVWHDTSHLDYHRGGYVRHGNHLDYIPGHYDVHRTGHWHR